MVNAFSVYGGIVDIRDFSRTVDPQQREDFKGYFTRSKENFQGWAGELFTDIKRSATEQLEYATGGYYQGKVEENEKEQLGVYLENIQAADKSFFENEQVVVWGDLEAKTLDRPIYVYMSCEAGDVKGEIFPEKLARKEYFENPEEGYEIEQLEQIGFECRFGKGRLETGTNRIDIKAEFNFETLSFLKTYFMDIERVRALRKENINPLTQYGIKDKTPTAVFTNGPVRLGIGTVDPPVGVNAEDGAYTYIGVTVERQWLGKIKNITELTIQVPNVLELGDSNLVCRDDFENLGEKEEGYNVYTLTDDAINKIKTPITDFRSWRCSINVPEASKVLGATPVTTYYYRANAKYVYEVKKPITVFVKSVPKERTSLSGCDINCTDSDGCICGADGCNVVEGSEVGKGFTCNNYFGGCSNKGRTVEQDLGYIDVLGAYIEGMIYINQRCLQGDTRVINESIDDSDGLSGKEKNELKNIVEGCEKRSYRFFEITEGLIVKRAGCGVDVFNVLKNKDLKDNLDGAKAKKDEFNALLGTAIAHFNENQEYAVSGKSSDNINKIESEREELRGVEFD